jgi:hypothetical protein
MCWRLVSIVCIAIVAVGRANAQDAVAEFYRSRLQALAEKIFATPATVVEQAKQAMKYRAP